MYESDQVLAALAAYFQMLSEPSRLKVLRCICVEEKPVSDIVSETGLSQTNVSRHLNMLYDAGMVSRRKEGSSVFYKVVDTSLIEICRTVAVRIASRIDDATPLRDAFLDYYQI